MSRRVSLPGADELFRPTSEKSVPGLRPGPGEHSSEKSSSREAEPREVRAGPGDRPGPP
jgi:hypothetical protein